MFRQRSGQSQAKSVMHESYLLTADFFQSLSNPAALMILEFVRKKGMTSSREIAEKLGIRPRAVLAELNAMERGGILVSHVKTQNTFYRADRRIIRAFDRILEFPARRMKRAGSPT